METQVFVWPVHLLTSLYRDLVGGPGRGPGFIIEHTEVDHGGEKNDKLTLKVHCDSPLLFEGRIDLIVSG
jgi:hypothetical protein